MQATSSIKQNSAFRRIYASGKSAASGHIVLYCKRNRFGQSRLGITASSKVGNAVIRNRVRRRLREIYRLHESEMRSGYDFVLVARVRAAGATYKQLERDFLRLADKLSLCV